MKENTVHTTEVFWSDNVNNDIDGIHPPVPWVDAHCPKRIDKAQLDGHNRNGKDCVGHREGEQSNVQPCWVDLEMCNSKFCSVMFSFDFVPDSLTFPTL